MANKIKFFVNVCGDMPEVTLKGNKYLAGHRGEIELDHVIEDDILKIELEGCGHHPRVGGASHIHSVSVRVCAKSVTTIALYDDPDMNAMGCCYCCANGCCVYGNSGCGCG
jgi:hypothetical protein